MAELIIFFSFHFSIEGFSNLGPVSTDLPWHFFFFLEKYSRRHKLNFSLHQKNFLSSSPTFTRKRKNSLTSPLLSSLLLSYILYSVYTLCPPIFLKWCLLIAKKWKNANRFRYLSKWRILKKTKNYKKLLNSISFPILLYLQAAEIILWSFFTVKKYHWIHDSSLIFKKYSQILVNRSVGVRPNVTVEYFSWISEIHINNSNSVVFLG